KFQNLIETDMTMGFSKGIVVLKEFLKKGNNREPSKPIPVLKMDSLDIVKSHPAKLTWFGHSAFLLEINDKNILIDPMFGDSPSPIPSMGAKRYSKELPIAIEKLPQIDAVIFSHDHYDHLDYESVQRLKGKVAHFYVPLAVGNHLLEWGVAEENITELNWWDEVIMDEITFVCTPARHFSGRGITNRFSTLWSSWIIKSDSLNLFFSGDSGYGPHFKEIGERFGPFDFAMMECGQYNENWDNIHMMPEETAQAAVDIKTKQMMPIHWGAFTLALHEWTDPVERVTKAAAKLKMPLVTPRIGQSIDLTIEVKPTDLWWRKL
ncbi:MAG: MBL fold metallo-hydrolase, partial [Spirosomaceae bacterium]|nr:MBL fold metallo-hydrolase [Spirosomataceae bacterium]